MLDRRMLLLEISCMKILCLCPLLSGKSGSNGEASISCVFCAIAYVVKQTRRADSLGAEVLNSTLSMRGTLETTLFFVVSKCKSEGSSMQLWSFSFVSTAYLHGKS
jgi:hypothetical protein